MSFQTALASLTASIGGLQAQAQAVADAANTEASDKYQQGYRDGVLAKESGTAEPQIPDTPKVPGEDMVSRKEMEDMKAEYERQLAELKSAPAPVDTTPFAQEDLDKARAEGKSEAEAVAEKKTAELMEEIKGLNLKLKEKDANALEEAVARKVREAAQESSDRLNKIAQELTERTPDTVETSPSPSVPEGTPDNATVPKVEDGTAPDGKPAETEIPNSPSGETGDVSNPENVQR